MTETVTTVSEGYGFLRKIGAADVLDTIANLSNDEVFTPPKLANQVLDLLPAHVWSDPNLKFLDPCVKTGIFLREIVKRLMAGLAKQIPDEKERREHILRNQVYGIAITELTSLMARRTVYCASDATREKNEASPENCFSAVKFDTPEGNIAFPHATHDWPHEKNGTVKEAAKCRVCGASWKDFGGEGREGMESYAYPFIHMDIQEIFGDMQFDVIIGNPPYQMKDGGNKSSATPIYQKFVDAAEALNPHYISMIIPSRWMLGGKGLDDFRSRMLADKRMKFLVDHINSSECFPGVDISGGVCYFLMSKDNKGKCHVTTKNGEQISSSYRYLGEEEFYIRFQEALSIVSKVKLSTQNFMSGCVSSRKPFGFDTSAKPTGKGEVYLFWRDGLGLVEGSSVTSGRHMIPKWKAVTSYVSYDHGGQAGRDGKRRVIGRIEKLPPGHVCSETYIVLDYFESETEADNMISFMKTKFSRFLLGLLVNTQHITKDRFKLVPRMDMSRNWSDVDLYAHFGIDQVEIAFIESMIKEMP